LLLASRDDVDGAIDQLERALDTRPDYADAHVNLGHALDGKGQHDAALAHYRAAVAADRRNVNAQASLALALAARGDTSEAKDHLRAALTIDPSDPRLHEAMSALAASAPGRPALLTP
jgi:tetratricopeptide (TPR) repeat protein